VLTSGNEFYNLSFIQNSNLAIRNTTNGSITYIYNDDSQTKGDKQARFLSVHDKVKILKANFEAVWQTESSEKRKAPEKECSLIAQDDGAAVFLLDGNLIWHSGAWPIGPSPSPTSTLAKGGSLNPGGMLVSPNFKFWMVVQQDGNLETYSKASMWSPVWSSDSKHVFATEQRNVPRPRLHIGPSGRWVMWSDATKKPLWRRPAEIQDRFNVTTLKLENDGRLILWRTSRKRKDGEEIVDKQPVGIWDSSNDKEPWSDMREKRQDKDITVGPWIRDRPFLSDTETEEEE
jgi:hypothetical protein